MKRILNEEKLIMKKTKIICTMGPGSNDKEVMRALIKSGMDIARFNMVPMKNIKGEWIS